MAHKLRSRRNSADPLVELDGKKAVEQVPVGEKPVGLPPGAGSAAGLEKRANFAVEVAPGGGEGGVLNTGSDPTTKRKPVPRRKSAKTDTLEIEHSYSGPKGARADVPGRTLSAVIKYTFIDPVESSPAAPAWVVNAIEKIFDVAKTASRLSREFHIALLLKDRIGGILSLTDLDGVSLLLHALDPTAVISQIPFEDPSCSRTRYFVRSQGVSRESVTGWSLWAFFGELTEEDASEGFPAPLPPAVKFDFAGLVDAYASK
jgi:hypothetical protein